MIARIPEGDGEWPPVSHATFKFCRCKKSKQAKGCACSPAGGTLMPKAMAKQTAAKPTTGAAGTAEATAATDATGAAEATEATIAASERLSRLSRMGRSVGACLYVVDEPHVLGGPVLTDHLF